MSQQLAGAQCRPFLRAASIAVTVVDGDHITNTDASFDNRPRRANVYVCCRLPGVVNYRF